MNVSTSTVQQQRRKPTTVNAVQDEDAAQLKLGPEFDVTQYTHDGFETALTALSTSEARSLINHTLKKRKNDALGIENTEDDTLDDEEEINANEVLRKTREYMNIFSRFREQQKVAAVAQILRHQDNADLHPFEIAQLGTLSCDGAEEAKTLIPSLAAKRSDAQLQELLDLVREHDREN